MPPASRTAVSSGSCSGCSSAPRSSERNPCNEYYSIEIINLTNRSALVTLAKWPPNPQGSAVRQPGGAMREARILIIGAGIGGLTAAIALGKRGFAIEMIERDPAWSVYGVGIIQQANVIRAMAELGIVQQ